MEAPVAMPAIAPVLRPLVVLLPWLDSVDGLVGIGRVRPGGEVIEVEEWGSLVVSDVVDDSNWVLVGRWPEDHSIVPPFVVGRTPMPGMMDGAEKATVIDSSGGQVHSEPFLMEAGAFSSSQATLD
jgi:hypothetical protein